MNYNSVLGFHYLWENQNKPFQKPPIIPDCHKKSSKLSFHSKVDVSESEMRSQLINKPMAWFFIYYSGNIYIFLNSYLCFVFMKCERSDSCDTPPGLLHPALGCPPRSCWRESRRGHKNRSEVWSISPVRKSWQLELFSLEKTSLWDLIVAFQYLNWACKKDGANFLAGLVTAVQEIMILNKKKRVHLQYI